MEIPPPAQVSLVSVNVARPTVLGRDRHGTDVVSAIAKQRVAAESIECSFMNLAGDEQADLTVHGGRDKAVYAYSADHFATWAAEIGRPFGAGAFGENLTVAGVAEDEVRIGDRWRWGEAVLEVAQPRQPCFKLTMHAGTAEVGRRMRASGRTGWYLRVLEPGRVPVAGPIAVERSRLQASVLEAHRAQRSGDAELVARVAASPGLAADWLDELR